MYLVFEKPGKANLASVWQVTLLFCTPVTCMSRVLGCCFKYQCLLLDAEHRAEHRSVSYGVACMQKGGKPQGDLIPVTCYTWEAPRVGTDLDVHACERD